MNAKLSAVKSFNISVCNQMCSISQTRGCVFRFLPFEIATFKPTLKKQSSPCSGPSFYPIDLFCSSQTWAFLSLCPSCCGGGLPAVNYEPVLCLQDWVLHRALFFSFSFFWDRHALHISNLNNYIETQMAQSQITKVTEKLILIKLTEICRGWFASDAKQTTAYPGRAPTLELNDGPLWLLVALICSNVHLILPWFDESFGGGAFFAPGVKLCRWAGQGKGDCDP